jgi:hypothetical protein
MIDRGEAATMQAQVTDNPAAPQRTVWLPEDAMARYWRAKTVGGVLFAMIFLGWLVIQWSNPIMRWLAISLVLATAWMTWDSIRAERRRFVGRKISVTADDLRIEQADDTREVALSRVDHLQWIDEGDAKRAAGLWCFDAQGNELLHMDQQLVANEREARSFLGWLRRETGLQAPVRWSTAR